MSGVSVDPPRAPSQTDTDMALAYEGGGNFMSRLQQLSDAKQQHDEALAELNLGKTAQAALSDAQSKQDEAASKLDEANRALAQAEQTAADVVNKARQDAAALIVNADTQASATAAAASRTRNEADAYANDKRQAADDSLKNALAIEEESKAANEQAKAALAEHQAAKVAADDAKAKAEAVYAKLAASINAAKDFHNSMAIELMGLTSDIP